MVGRVAESGVGGPDVSSAIAGLMIVNLLPQTDKGDTTMADRPRMTAAQLVDKRLCDMLGHVTRTQQPLVSGAIRGIFTAARPPRHGSGWARSSTSCACTPPRLRRCSRPRPCHPPTRPARSPGNGYTACPATTTRRSATSLATRVVDAEWSTLRLPAASTVQQRPNPTSPPPGIRT
jgi:hypothetical protein